MAKTGLLGNAFVSAGNQNSGIEVYTVPSGNAAVVSYFVTTDTPDTKSFDLSFVSANETLFFTRKAMMYFRVPITKSTPIEGKLVMGEQESIYFRAPSDGPSIHVWGFEEID